MIINYVVDQTADRHGIERILLPVKLVNCRVANENAGIAG
jgi:hypothetical protein